jgi:hypothetical protein
LVLYFCCRYHIYYITSPVCRLSLFLAPFTPDFDTSVEGVRTVKEVNQNKNTG